MQSTSTMIPGKLKVEDLDQLGKLVESKCVLMLGCYCGRGLLALARHVRKVWVLDDFKYPGGIEGIVEELKSNVNRSAPEDAEINLLYGSTESWAVPFGSEDLRTEEVDMVYRDANRPEGYRDVDECMAMVLLRKGGIYAWHDKEHNLKWLQVQPVPVEVN